MPRGRPKKVNPVEEVREEEVAKLTLPQILEEKKEAVQKETPIEFLPLECYADYKEYNRRARLENKRAKRCIYPIKQCPLEYHPTQRVVFERVDQPKNALPVKLCTDMIDFQKTLYPGKVYDLPIAVLKFLAQKGVPIWDWFENADGSKETRISHYEKRFALRSVFEED